MSKGYHKNPLHGREVTCEEVAQELKVTRQCVDQVERRALAKLKKLLEEMGLTKEDLL